MKTSVLKVLLVGVTATIVATLSTSAPATRAAPLPTDLTRVTTLGVGTFLTYAAVRTQNGDLHLIYQTTAPNSAAPDGLATRSISPAGVVGAQVTALTGWGTSVPGLVALPNGTLEAAFGAVAPQNVSDLWGINSTDGGATWSAPAQIGSGSQDEVQAYGAAITGALSGSTPVWTLSVGGGLVVQQGLGPNTPTVSLLSGASHFASDVDSAVDAATGQVVTSWDSVTTNGGDFLQGAAPGVGPPQTAAGQSKNELVVAGRDTGPGVFAAYTADGSHVRLLEYGGGTVAVGSLPGVKAEALGVATGIDGRIWVMWGDESGLAVTRSNKAVTKFEPIQQLTPNALTLYRLGGDGRLGPLDFLVDMIPGGATNVPGTFYTRVLPELTAVSSVTVVKNQLGKVIAHTLTVHVSDAGDAVVGATVTVAGNKHTTNGSGTAKFALSAQTAGEVAVTVAAPTYRILKLTVKI